MLKLNGHLPMLQTATRDAYLVTVTTNDTLPSDLRSGRALMMGPGLDPEGFKAVLVKERVDAVSTTDSKRDVFLLSNDYDYLDEGDILRLDPNTGAMRCLHRRNSHHNTILLTERCDHYCLMCSQPPKEIDDAWLLDEAKNLISLIPRETQHLGFSGGEPTMYGERFIELLQHTKHCLPTTAIDVLSNGRAFKDIDFTRSYAEVNHPNLMMAIPIYSDDPVRHDYVVQSKGAFDETVLGILNLKSLNQRVEIRIVIHKQTVDRLVNTCQFIARNLLFVDHVALMGLEITGFTRTNLETLWIDPYEYKDILSEAITTLNSYGIPASVYNHQLCTINSDAMNNYRKSISDWKNEYLEECGACTKRDICGGLFSSSKKYKHSAYIKAFL
ncbi:MAG: His-Xaa-Ser system radical SAM maturase HxsC [Nitrospira sp.]